MNIVAIDTTEDILSLAVLARGKRWRWDKTLAAPHDETMFDAMERLLRRAGLRLEDADGLAAASGPGRFTGIRIGMTFCAVASSRLRIPAVGVNRLEALAFNMPGPRVCATIPGWREERFYQIFERGRGGRLKPVCEPRWATAHDWHRIAGELACADTLLREATPRAADLLDLAVELLGRDRLPKLEPLYVKPAGYERKPKAGAGR